MSSAATAAVRAGGQRHSGVGARPQPCVWKSRRPVLAVAVVTPASKGSSGKLSSSGVARLGGREMPSTGASGADCFAVCNPPHHPPALDGFCPDQQPSVWQLWASKLHFCPGGPALPAICPSPLSFSDVIWGQFSGVWGPSSIPMHS